MSRFGVIYADPPWSFRNWSTVGEGRNACKHYDVMSLKQIQALPVREVAAEDCVLLMWVTFPLLKQGIATMEAWGFEYKTCGFSWMKTCANGALFMGTGYWTRANAEVCLLGTIGKPKRKSAAVKQAIQSIPGRHSEKPRDVYSRIERLVDGPYLELFARNGGRPGWVHLGNELTGRSIDEDLLSLAGQQAMIW